MHGQQNIKGKCVDRKRIKNSRSNEETRAICRSRDIITLMKVMLLQFVEYFACTQEAGRTDRALLGMEMYACNTDKQMGR